MLHRTLLLLGFLAALAVLPRLSSAQSPIVPGELSNSFTVPLLDDQVFTFNNNALSGYPLLIMALNQSDLFSAHMFHSNDSVDDWLVQAPNNTQYLFLAYSSETLPSAAQQTAYMRQRIIDRMNSLQWDSSKQNQTLSRMFFSNTSADHVGGFLQDLLFAWPTPTNQLLINDTSNPETYPRLDALYEWANWPTPGQSGEVILLEDPCRALDDYSNLFVFSPLPIACDVYTAINNIQNSNAQGVIFASNESATVIEIGETLIPGVGIIVSMIGKEDGRKFMNYLANQSQVPIVFETNNMNGSFAGIDLNGYLFEVGWAKFSTLMYLGWQAQYQNYLVELSRNLSKPAFVIPIMQDQVMLGDRGAIGNFSLDEYTFKSLWSYSMFELDFALGCPGSMDEDCEIWDYTVNLFVCCYADEYGNNGSDPMLCNQELGRWITPFRRRIGRWLTPVSPLLPLLTSTKCGFQVVTAPWASLPWLSTLNLRFSEPLAEDKTRMPPPTSLLPLFQGGTFDSTYNNRSPIYTVLPAHVSRVELEAVITGHGSDENGCGEFCVTEHYFVINGHVSSVVFSEAGTYMGCANKVPLGVEPNQHGTYNYGRDGWCDGLEVRPWVVDVSAFLQPTPFNNTIIYYGYYNGSTPNPTQSPGEIIMYSNLVFYSD